MTKQKNINTPPWMDELVITCLIFNKQTRLINIHSCFSTVWTIQMDDPTDARRTKYHDLTEVPYEVISSARTTTDLELILKPSGLTNFMYDLRYLCIIPLVWSQTY